MVSDAEPRYRLVDSNGNIVGSLYAQADGTLALQEGTSGSDNEVTVATDGTFNAPAVSTDGVRNGAVSGEGDLFRLAERQTPGSNIGQITFTGLEIDKEYRIYLNSRSNSGDVYLRLNGDGSSTGNYQYWDASSTKQTGENQFLVVSLSDTADYTTSIYVDNGRFSETAGEEGIRNALLPGTAQRISDFGREGGRTVGADALSSIELFADGNFSGGQTVVELWERDYA